MGTGFTGRFALGQRPLRWADVADWVRCVRALLEGETTDWEGERISMLHPDGFGPVRPIQVPFIMGAAGPKGQAVAREVADGVIVAGGSPESGVAWQARLSAGTVLDDGEEVDAERVFAAAGHIAAVGYHFAAENDRGIERLPDAEAWLAAYDDVAPQERHLAMHDRHLIAVNERDAPFITPAVMSRFDVAWTPARLRENLSAMGDAGITEVVYQPAGPDIERELTAYMEAARG